MQASLVINRKLPWVRDKRQEEEAVEKGLPELYLPESVEEDGGELITEDLTN